MHETYDGEIFKLVEPKRVPAAIKPRLGIGGGRNAGLLAVRILGASDEGLRKEMVAFQSRLSFESQSRNRKLQFETKDRRSL